MPLIKGKSDRAFSENVRTEMHEGKPQKQSLAIAYAMKRKAKMAKGGFVEEEESSGYEPMPCPEKYADGGFVKEEEETGYEDVPMERHEKHNEGAMEEDEHMEHEEEEEDMVGRIMKQRMAKGGMAHHYSEGGRVANEDHGPDDEDLADFSPNEFDDLVLDDHLEGHYPGSQEIGDEQEDEDRRDIVSRIMKSRMKKDRMPSPA
jgi:hypothetical protein